MSTDNHTTDDTADAPTDEQINALADRVIKRMEERGDIDADGLVARSSRRGILKALGAGALGAGVVGGATDGASADLSTDGDAMAVGGTLDVDDSYRISGRWYMGPDSARPSSPDTTEQAIWEVTDVGDAGTTKPYRWTGSQWVPMSKYLDLLATDDATVKNSFTDPLGGVIDDAILAHSKTNRRVESGNKPSIGPTNSSANDTWASAKKSSDSVTFERAFSTAAPKILTTPNKVPNEPLTTNGLNPSSTGFDVGTAWWSTASPTQRDVWWLALGED